MRFGFASNGASQADGLVEDLRQVLRERGHDEVTDLESGQPEAPT